MNTDGTGFHTCKGCHKTESLWNHNTTDHKEGEQLEDRRNVVANSRNSGDGADQRVQFLKFMMNTQIGGSWLFQRRFGGICLLHLQLWNVSGKKAFRSKHLEMWPLNLQWWVREATVSSETSVRLYQYIRSRTAFDNNPDGTVDDITKWNDERRGL